MRHLIPSAVLLIVTGCAAEPAQPHLFDVFFESSKASLTPDAREIVDQVASAAHSEQPTRIVVSGTATGDTQRDAKLASERADAVVQALVAAKIDPSLIDKEAAVVKPAASTVVDRIAGHKVQIELVPTGAIALRPSKAPAQWSRSPYAHAAPGVDQQAQW